MSYLGRWESGRGWFTGGLAAKRSCLLICSSVLVVGEGLKSAGWFKCNRGTSGPTSATFSRTENKPSLQGFQSRELAKQKCLDIQGEHIPCSCAILKSSIGLNFRVMWKISRVSLKKIGKFTGKPVGILG